MRRSAHVVITWSSSCPPTPLIMLSQGKEAFHTCRMDGEGGWEIKTHIHTNLPLGTVLLVEMVDERKCKGQRRQMRYHVMNILAWSSVYLTHLSFHCRRKHLKMLLQASMQQSILHVHMTIKPLMQLAGVEKGCLREWWWQR